MTELDIERGCNVIETAYGPVTVTSPCGYAVLEPMGNTRAIAALNGETVGVGTANDRFTWFGFSLSAGLDGVGNSDTVLGLASELGISGPVEVEGDRVVPVVRHSAKGSWLIFVLNLERRTAQVKLRPRCQIEKAYDLLSGSELSIAENAFQLKVPSWEVAVIRLHIVNQGATGDGCAI